MEEDGVFLSAVEYIASLLEKIPAPTEERA